jgi:hypothetical protein
MDPITEVAASPETLARQRAREGLSLGCERELLALLDMERTSRRFAWAVAARLAGERLALRLYYLPQFLDRREVAP